MEQISKRLEEMLTTINAATPGPYHVEIVHHDEDIAYEVSIPKQGFHVAFYQFNCMDHGITAKNQANLYAQSRTDWERTVKALQVAVERLQKYCKCWDTKLCSDCKTLEKIEEILNGKV